MTLPVDPARQDGHHLVADLPAGPVLLPGDVATVVTPDGRTGLARVACVDLTRRCLYLAVTWPHPLTRRVPAAVLTAAVTAAAGTAHPAELAQLLAATRGTARV